MTIKFSIIIPTFNRSNKTFNLVNSILPDLHDNDEIILVDDCSTDDTSSMIAKITDSRLSYIKLPANSGGPSYPRNVALEKSKNDWIAFCDSDDTWPANKLSTLRMILNKTKFIPDYIYHQSVSLSNNKLLSRPPSSSIRLFPEVYNFTDMNIPMSTLVIRKTSFLKQLPNLFPVGPEWKAIEDSVVNYSLFYDNKKSMFIPGIYSQYNDLDLDRISGLPQYLRKYRFLKANPFNLSKFNYSLILLNISIVITFKFMNLSLLCNILKMIHLLPILILLRIYFLFPKYLFLTRSKLDGNSPFISS